MCPFPAAQRSAVIKELSFCLSVSLGTPFTRFMHSRAASLSRTENGHLGTRFTSKHAAREGGKRRDIGDTIHHAEGLNATDMRGGIDRECQKVR